MKNRIHHIVLTVTDVKKSTEFYCKVLGWQIRRKAEDYTEFVPPDDASEQNFLFVIGTPRDHQIIDNRFDRNRIGLDHFAFLVETQEELQAIEQRLRAANIKMEDGGITTKECSWQRFLLQRFWRSFALNCFTWRASSAEFY